MLQSPPWLRSATLSLRPRDLLKRLMNCQLTSFAEIRRPAHDLRTSFSRCDGGRQAPAPARAGAGAEGDFAAHARREAAARALLAGVEVDSLPGGRTS